MSADAAPRDLRPPTCQRHGEPHPCSRCSYRRGVNADGWTVDEMPDESARPEQGEDIALAEQRAEQAKARMATLWEGLFSICWNELNDAFADPDAEPNAGRPAEEKEKP